MIHNCKMHARFLGAANCEEYAKKLDIENPLCGPRGGIVISGLTHCVCLYAAQWPPEDSWETDAEDRSIDYFITYGFKTRKG